MMRATILCLALFFSSLLFANNFPKNSSEQAPQYQRQHASQTTDGFSVPSYLATRDSLGIIACPGCQISRSKVQKMLKTVNISRNALASTKKADEIKHIIEKFNKLLQTQRVNSDKELLFTVYGMLGVQYSRLYTISGRNNKKYLKQALKYTKSAIGIFKDNPAYKADLATGYTVLTGILFLKNNYDKAISLTKYLIEHYQQIGLGPFNNWYASQKVKSLKNLLRRDNLKSKRKQKIITYLKMIAEKYRNEVGITAQIALQQHYIKLGNQNKVAQLAQSIKNRLHSLSNGPFKKDVRKMQNLRLIQAKNMQANRQSDRDTAYYALKRKKIKTATLSNVRNRDRYFISIQLKKPYQAEFAQLTAANIGNMLIITYQDSVVSSPIIQSIISSGYLSVGSFKNLKKAKAMKQQLLKDRHD